MVMTIHPLFWPFVLLRITLATTPPPRIIRMAVPMISERNGFISVIQYWLINGVGITLFIYSMIMIIHWHSMFDLLSSVLTFLLFISYLFTVFIIFYYIYNG